MYRYYNIYFPLVKIICKFLSNPVKSSQTAVLWCLVIMTGTSCPWEQLPILRGVGVGQKPILSTVIQYSMALFCLFHISYQLFILIHLLKIAFFCDALVKWSYAILYGPSICELTFKLLDQISWYLNTSKHSKTSTFFQYLFKFFFHIFVNVG